MIEDGKIVIGKVVNVNFAVDHRYVDGGRCKNLVSSFKSVFENPEQYLRADPNAKTSEIKKSE